MPISPKWRSDWKRRCDVPFPRIRRMTARAPRPSKHRRSAATRARRNRGPPAARANPASRKPFTIASSRRWRVCWAVPTNRDPPTIAHRTDPRGRGDAGRCVARAGTGYQHQFRLGWRSHRAHDPIGRAVDGTVAGAVDPGDDDVVHPDRGGAVVAADRARHRDAPPNAVIVSLAQFLTAFVMGPALQRSYEVGVRPLMNNEINVEQAFERSAEP